jgi:hypothetical protein
MRRTTTLKTITLTFLMLFATAQLFAAGARRGWTKIELSSVDGKSAPAPAALLTRFGAELIADYGAYAIVYVPKGIVTAMEAQAAKENIRVRARDELDVLELPGAAVDAREGLAGVPAEKLTREYPAGKPGVYVLQFIGPPRGEWTSQLQSIGWTLSRYIPNNGYLIVGTPELVGRTRGLAFVQWLDFYHPYQKPAFLAHDGKLHDQLFELAEGAGAASGIEAIRGAAVGEIRVQQTSFDTRVHARMSDAAAEALLRHEMILSVSPEPEGKVSDERQAMSLTSNLDATQSQPTNPGGYWSWVLSRCPECASMPASTWKVGIADGGLDNGALTGGHLDLAGRKYFGHTFYTGADDPLCPPGQLLCDAYAHGTIVAGIAVGNASTGDINGPYKDSLGFLLGQGVAPTAGAFMTKIYTKVSGFNLSNIFPWVTDAANAGVTIQNHSLNEYSLAHAGTYSTVSRDYDIATRDADGTVNFSRVPMLFSVSSGNHEPTDQNQYRFLTLPGATAKNVLSVGGLENYRQDLADCRLSHGDSFRNIMRYGRVGTDIGGYYKPDVMAPASLIVSSLSSILWPNPSPYCFKDVAGHREYTGDTGTSFAAPVGAAASLIVKRYLGTSPADVSPALTRAVLIAGAHSVRGGLDRTQEPTVTTVGPIPSQQQGFGRLSFEDILNGSNKPVVFDQAFNRTFTAAGQSFSTTVHVHDATKPVKVALVWTDTPATAFAPNPLVNDLNLEVRRSSNSNVVYVGNSLAVSTEAKGEESIAWPSVGSLPYDSKNTVEVFRLFANAGEDLTITVKAWNIVGDTNENTSNFEQDFALAILNVDNNSCTPGVITQQPQSQTIIPGATATINVVVTGTGPFNYQWYQAPSGSFVNPAGFNATYTTPPLTTTKPYWVQVTDTCVGGFLNSNTATITVQCTAAPAITVQPTSRVTTSGQSTTLSVSATQAVGIQWYQGNSPSTANPISGATNATLTVAPTSTTNYWVRITNGCGTADSVTATVCVLPLITAQPTSRTINPGQSTTLTVTASGATTYQWFQGTAPSTTTPVGTNSSSLTVTPPATTNYWVRVTNSCGSVNSTTATVTVAPPPPPQIARIQSTFALANSQQSITANWAQPTQAGTFLVAVISSEKDPGGYITWTPPAGWSLAVMSEWTNIKLAVYYLPNNGGARTSETFSVSPGFHDQTLYLLEYSGIMATNPLDKTGTAGNDTNNGYVQTGFTANTVQPKELVITALSTYTQTDFSVTPADGYTEVYDKFMLYHLTTAMYEKIPNAIASYGHGANVGVPAQWVGLVATFKAVNTN